MENVEGEGSRAPTAAGLEGQAIHEEQVNQPDPNAGMLAAIMRLIEQNARLIELQAGQARRPNTLLAKQFKGLGAKDFAGSIDPTEVENWLKDAVHILDRIGVTEDDRVDFLTFMFKGDALHWWEATKRLLTMPLP
ncbi:hypothetical protein RHMOL_Rhmol12G0091000 [Rhododendron molle]|uniref:Uncharacterized protein n=1 Tax=Rhododendron molle TaxID=49168 RepID=A0ACC0LFY3_RHOML|nr:hypothetical protein RHMOL_Rhmol12G0091000 [Rhododendron molle]